MDLLLCGCKIYKLCMLLLTLVIVVSGELSDTLQHYEILDVDDLSHRIVKRSVDGERALERHLQFNVLNRAFHLNLKVKQRVVSPEFRVFVADEHNRETQVNHDFHNFYEGYVYDEPWTSDASAYFDEDGTLTATISTRDDVYSIEPAWRHNLKLKASSMVAYKKSDISMEEDLGNTFCGLTALDNANKTLQEKVEETSTHGEGNTRTKRQAGSNPPQKNTCPLLLVADYRFFTVMGQNSRSKTINYLIGLVDRVDRIFRKTDFGYGYSDMGFEVKRMRIHESYTVPTNPREVHYNQDIKLNTTELLKLFSTDETIKHVCLAHLFTHQKFDGGVLGLAYISSPRSYSVGGICTPVYYKDGKKLYLNTGWSSSLNRYNRRLLTQEADLVTTHEFGHNWGSEHDPDTSECSPSSSRGGKHIMYTYSVSGYERNNKNFSACSKRSIAAVLQAKSHICFTEKSPSFCGNFLVEGDEECDVGPLDTNDVCCSRDCQLNPGAKCSDSNDVCCRNCEYASSDLVCHSAVNGSCLGEATCTGDGPKCPEPPPMTNGHSCLNSGECVNGECQSRCNSLDREPCVCDDPDLSCKLCCRDLSLASNCTLYSTVEDFNLADGSPCAHGLCDKGVCIEQVQDLVARLWDVIENITPDALVKFMRANIVGTIIILSLFLWIPASCFISYIDRKREREREMKKFGPDHYTEDLSEPPEWEPAHVKIKRVQGTKRLVPDNLHLRIPPPTYPAQPQRMYLRHQSWTTAV